MRVEEGLGTHTCTRCLTALGVLCCFVVCMALLASFFLPSASLINICITFSSAEVPSVGG